jgi:hypothetical protein
MRIRMIVAGLAAWAALGASPGCSTLPDVTRPRMPTLRETVSPNPLVVPTQDFELVWREVVRVLDEYFDVASENRLSGQIVTQPKVAATLFEPWAGDSVGLHARLEATLQSIRRFSKVTVRPAPGGGYAVKVEVYKQLEDLGRPDRQMGGRAVFDSVFPINRTREVVGPVPAPLLWIPRGRDYNLEQVILARIREDLAL